jgi:bleomycin hydrolase
MKKYILPLLIAAACHLNAQEKTNRKDSEYRFTVIKNLDATPVQNQNMTSTCWSFSSLSFFESEMIRMGKPKDLNLSEMYVVRQVYPLKADNYVRMHGKTNFGTRGSVYRQEGRVRPT